jgi:hypothetical protein
MKRRKKMKKEYGPADAAKQMQGLAEAVKQVMLEERLAKLPMDHTLRYLYKNGMLATVENYIRLNFLGEFSTLDELGPEDRVEIDQLIEDGFLVDTKSQRVN